MSEPETGSGGAPCDGVRRILVVWSGPISGTSANLFRALSDKLGEFHHVVTAPNDSVTGGALHKLANTFWCNARRTPKIIWADTIIVHSYAALSLPSILLARGLGRKVVVIHWDAYPITVAGQPLGGRLRALFDRIEKYTVGLATRVIIPSEDFRPFVQHRDLRVLPLWPSTTIREKEERPAKMTDAPVRLAFTGQAGLTRGLRHAIVRLSQEAPQKFELNIYGPTRAEAEWSCLARNVEVVDHGNLSQDELSAELVSMDFGLISLHPDLGQPGFPSKVFDYVAAGLPVIYAGRSLPGFCEILETSGIGMALTNQAVDWTRTTLTMHENFASSLSDFLLQTSLSADKLKQIVQ